MRIAAVMQELADRLDTIDGLRAFGWPKADPSPPAGIVGYPEEITSESYGNGLVSTTVPVWVVVGKVSDRTTRDVIDEYVAGTGPKSVVQTLESGQYTAFDTIAVTLTGFDTPDLEGGEYLAAVFDVDITGSGA